MTIAVVSAVFGAYDEILPPVEQTVDVAEWVMVTDEPDLHAPGWRVVVERRPHVHSNVAAKIPKLFPNLYTAAEITVWMDASAVIGPNIVRLCCDALGVSNWAQLPHAHRNDLLDEVACSRTMSKYDGQDLEGQVASYLAEGMPSNYGLWATGLIARRKSVVSGAVGNRWLREIIRWSFQDQLSEAYAFWTLDMRPAAIAADHCSIPSEIWWRSHRI